MARGSKTGGRKKGSLNKITAEMKEAIASSGETPLEYMLRLMRDPQMDAHRRDEMAKAAAPYLHPRLASLEQKIESEMRQHIISDRPMNADEWNAKYCVGPANGAATSSH